MLNDFHRSFKGMAMLLVLFAIAGCERSDPRIKRSIEALHWSGGNAKDQRIRDSLKAALEKATPASLSKTELVSATATLNVGRGVLQADWIGAVPNADAMRILLPDGGVFDFPFDPIDLAQNEATSANLLIYQASISAQRDQPQGWDMIIASPSAKAVLLKNSKIVSNGTSLVLFTPPPPSTTPDTGKMIGTIDSGGRATIYRISRSVNAGDTLALNDLAPVAYSVSANPIVKTEDILDQAGPTAYIGRKFATGHSANEILTTKMFTTTPDTAPVITK